MMQVYPVAQSVMQPVRGTTRHSHTNAASVVPVQDAITFSGGLKKKGLLSRAAAILMSIPLLAGVMPHQVKAEGPPPGQVMDTSALAVTRLTRETKDYSTFFQNTRVDSLNYAIGDGKVDVSALKATEGDSRMALVVMDAFDWDTPGYHWKHTDQMPLRYGNWDVSHYDVTGDGKPDVQVMSARIQADPWRDGTYYLRSLLEDYRPYVEQESTEIGGEFAYTPNMHIIEGSLEDHDWAHRFPVTIQGYKMLDEAYKNRNSEALEAAEYYKKIMVSQHSQIKELETKLAAAKKALAEVNQPLSEQTPDKTPLGK